MSTYFVVVGLTQHPNSKKASVCNQCSVVDTEAQSLDLMHCFANNGVNGMGVYRFATDNQDAPHMVNPFVYKDVNGNNVLIEEREYKANTPQF